MFKTKSEYKNGLAELIYYFEDEPDYGTDEGIAYEVLLNSVREYEIEHIPPDAHVLDIRNNAVRLRKAIRAMSADD